MKKSVIALYLFLVFNQVAFAQKDQPVFDKEKWVEFIAGDMPLVISVPHGGTLLVDSLPQRDCDGAIIGIDIHTIELARLIRSYFKDNYNVVPYVVMSHIARKHVDQNRDIDADLATCGNKQNEKAWFAYHHKVDSALQLAKAKHDRVMFVDLHGHSHKNQRIEVGYNITWGELNRILAGTFNNPKKEHSFSNLLRMDKSLDLTEMLFGGTAFGTLLVNNGLPATPSKQDLVPQKGEAFYSGGDNTRRYTHPKYKNVFGLQLECDRTARLAQNRKNTAKAIALSLAQYLDRFANTKLLK